MDIQYLLWLQGLRESLGGVVNAVMLTISWLGEAALPLILAFGLYWCLNKSAGLYLLFTCSLSDFVGNILKLTCCVYRPWIRDPAVHPAQGALKGATGYSFPSGHSSKAVAAYGGLAIVGQKRRWMVIAMSGLTLLILFSRNYLGVHTPQDVITGAALGAVTLWLVSVLLSWTDGGKNRDRLLTGIILTLCLAALIYASLKSYPMEDGPDGALLVDPVQMLPDAFNATGAMIGLMIGWLWEKRHIRFSVEGGAGAKTLRFLSGIAMLLLFFSGLRPMLRTLLGANAGNMLGSALTLLYGTAVHPLLFTAWEKRIFKRGASKTVAQQ